MHCIASHRRTAKSIARSGTLTRVAWRADGRAQLVCVELIKLGKIETADAEQARTAPTPAPAPSRLLTQAHRLRAPQRAGGPAGSGGASW